ncbi:MAG: DUF2062 domain-containing protein [Verrucomicrobia bacterium]|nr:DUF2062 domain-containing protein [Verrucomicrobiota bacterium]
MTQIDLTATPPSWWKRRVIAPITRQLTQGATPARLALALAVGGVIAVNPFLGTTTFGCVVAGVLFRLNQPMLQVANVLGAPFQLALILPWVRCGEWLYRAEPMPISPKLLAEEFNAGPWQFLQQFGITGLHAATAWLLAAAPLGFALYFMLQPPLRALGRRFTAKPVH